MKLPLAYYNDPVLRQKGQRVDQIDDPLRQLIADMLETMHALNGIGLAAPQVHRSLTLFVTCVPVQKQGKWEKGVDRIFINPQILSQSREMQTFTEGCLSIPKLYLPVTRPAKIEIQATDLEGNIFHETLVGFPATNFMHEYDHLNGILITDHLSQEERKNLAELFTTSLQR